MSEISCRVIALEPGEGRMLQLAGGEWVWVVGIARNSSNSTSGPDGGPTLGAEADLDYTLSTHSMVAKASIGPLKIPSLPTWGTVMVTAPTNSLGRDIDFIDESAFKVRFEPNPGVADIPGLHVLSPHLADAIELDRAIEIDAAEISGI